MTPAEVLALYPPHDGSTFGLLESRRAVGPHRPLLFFDGRTWSWAEIHARALAAAQGLVAAGIRKGDRVAVMAPNSDHFVVTILALHRIGAILVPINPDFGVEEARYIIEHAEVAGILAASAALPTATRAGDRIRPWLRAIDAPWDVQAALPPLPDPDTCCLIMYTSGTTGFPKGAMHSQRNFVTAGEGFVARLHLQPDERLLAVLPLFHVNALFYSLGGTLAAGASLALAERFSASRFWPLVAASGATELNIIAAIGSILAQRPRREFVPGHTLRKIYGAPLTAAMVEAFHAFGVPHVIEGYGMTEIPGVANQPFGEPAPLGSMGKPSRHPDPARRFAEMKVIDDDGNDVPAGEIGELAVKTPIVMQSYYKEPDKTAEAFRDGWFLTGDLVRRDVDGWYWFIARKKDIIRRRGENISGAELDRVIGEHPAVAEAAAIAVPSPLGEDDILVAAVPRAGMALTPKDIAEWCRDRLAAIKRPRYVLITDALPHTPTHRVAKYRLKQDPELLGRAIDLEPEGGRPKPTP
jgi:crotonobetaine/carnitine-CoA ligase